MEPGLIEVVARATGGQYPKRRAEIDDLDRMLRLRERTQARLQPIANDQLVYRRPDRSRFGADPTSPPT